MIETVEFNVIEAASKLKECGHRQARGTGGMVVTAFPSASEAGVEMLRAGGNAIDAAVAAAWALAVCEPSGSGLGGQTTLLIRLAGGRTTVVDGHSHAPAAVSTKRVSRVQQQKGYRACTIPSTPATLEFARKRYGVLSRAAVMEPAIRLAQDGYAITKLQRRQMKWCLNALLASAATTKLFLRKERPCRIGEIFRQEELAATLRRLADVGVEDFYKGRIACAIVDDMARNGGLITEEDLAEYEVPIECEPVAIGYRGCKVVSVPPPGGGLNVLSGLKILEHIARDDLVRENNKWYELLAELTHAVFHERDRFAVHPRDVTPSLLEWFLGDERASEIAERIETCGCESAGRADVEEPGETTHLCTMDREGNAVSLTQSIQSLFGAKVANGQLGFLYNNYLCTCRRGRHPYRLGSACIPRSNIAPTLVLRTDLSRGTESRGDTRCAPELLLVLGAAGSRRITSAILHVISGVLDRGVSLDEAVDLPRIHGLLSPKVHIEKPAATETLLKRLEKRFREVKIRAHHSYFMGCVQAIYVGDDKTLLGVADPRRDGAAAGF
ncbi:MAG TPA: gamma-glutamyltransferase [Sedimentisphaerales bacterium]|nr:gamma-glutamyltransferase [Sedimentisphaerales bacterium]